MRDNMKGIIPPPLIFVICILLAFLLHWLWPAYIFSGYLWVRIPIGGHLLFISGIMAIHAFRQMKKLNTQIGFDASTTAIVTEGPFRFSRNPLYLSLIILYLAITFLFGSLWFILLLCIMIFLFIDIVKSEEYYLESKFGESYLNYKNKVRRWV